ncbi:MAG: DUF423 domain-containing protein [Flavobacteriaceae bacterium]|nr:DUF423 domain-containing protein [Flavobacteriaceae bacterium]
MRKKTLITGVIFGFLAVILGAFGAHTLKKMITPEMIQTFETGVRYQIYHALLLIGISQLKFLSDRSLKMIWMLILIGVVFFSGSIYLLATNNLSSFDFKTIGIITPIGGLLLLSGWGLLLMKCLKQDTF